MTGARLSTIRDQLLPRDLDLLGSIEKYRLLTTRQLQRLHFDSSHPTPLAAARACHRTLTRLKSLRVVAALQRRIGGVRAGSAGTVWYIGSAGERLLRALHSVGQTGRRNYREPSRYFVEHTLAIAELAIQATEAARDGRLEVLQIDTEPASWQQSLSRHGTAQWLEPDLRLVTATPTDEFHWFVEVDLDSEHLPIIRRQCLAYQAFRASGRYQAEHHIYPLVVWVVPTDRRRGQLHAGIAADTQLDQQLFTVVTSDQVVDLLRTGEQETNNQPGGQEGGTPS